MSDSVQQPPPLLEMRQLCFRWPGASQAILCGVDFRLAPGEAVCLQAPSGRGKTTLLRLAAGMLRPSAGVILRNFRRPAFAFQEQRLLPWMNAVENIDFTARCGRNAALEWLQRAGMAECAGRLPATLSGGQCQRINLLRALAADPDMLFLDEPFNGLDAAAAERLSEMIRQWRARHPAAGLLMVSHLPEAAELCGAVMMPWPGTNKENP